MTLASRSSFTINDKQNLVFVRKRHTSYDRTKNVGELIRLTVSDTLGHTGRPINESKLVSCWRNALLITPVGPRTSDKSRHRTELTVALPY